MKIGYRKCFNLGNYENEVIFIEGDVPDEDDFAPVFENMKNAVEDLHRRSLEIDTERSESEKKARQEEEERKKAENPSYGYANCWKVLNAKDYGVPQNRERVFLVSHLGDELYHFPEPFPLAKTLDDILEDEVDDGFYLSEKQVEHIFAYLGRKQQEGCGFKPNIHHCGGGAVSARR